MGRAYSDGPGALTSLSCRATVQHPRLTNLHHGPSMLYKFVPTTYLLGPGGGRPPNVLLGAAEGFSFPSTGLMKLLLELELILAMGITRNHLRRPAASDRARFPIP